MILQKRTFDELKVSAIKIQRWYKNLRFAKAFLLYNPEVTNIEKNLREYVEENDDYVSFSNIHDIAIENRVGFNICIQGGLHGDWATTGWQCVAPHP